MAAVVSGMIIQCTPVSFGALGTPILVGVSTGLSGDESVASWAVGAGFVTAEGQPDMPLILKEVGWRVAVLHAVVGTVIPLFLTATMTRLFGPRRSFGEGLACWPFALVASLSMTLPYTLVAYVLGPEFPRYWVPWQVFPSWSGVCGVVGSCLLGLRYGPLALPPIGIRTGSERRVGS